ncbi:MAG: SDR family NAD(P)-dependent oxidoreductase [Planctomycetaceae bacterium]|jgi:short-subunit dehydrogenase|nr:SDR family NAD(P)-dependent oxidoreductase [Planctomycetaceae bacterium]
MKRLLKNSRILLTGASSGIGAALALELAKEGADLVLLARRADRLQEVAERIQKATGSARKIITVVGDITDSEIRQLAVQTATQQLGGLDILINNAGVGATALIEATTEETIRRIFEVNFFALLELTQLALPSLKLGNKPMVVNLSSIVGLRGVPHYGVYGAAKFAVTGLSEAMRAEFHQHGIDVLLVCPGTTQTEFFDVLYQSSSAPDMPVHHAVTPEYVAARIVRAMKKGQHKIIPYFQAIILDYLNRFAPLFTDWIMTKFVSKN